MCRPTPVVQRRGRCVRRTWLVPAALVVALSGCAGVPQSGAVHVGRALPADTGQYNELIGGRPSGPLPGMSPIGLIDGFLDAQVEADDGFVIAKTFLAPGTTWNPRSGTSIYDDASIRVRLVRPRVVDVDARRTGVVDPRGDYRVAPASMRWRYEVVRRSGQWRISRLPAGALLGIHDAQQSLESASIYYLNRAQSAVVPEPVLVPPDLQGFATRLVQNLLDGPGAGIGPAVTTAVPRNTALQGNVTVGADGGAELNLIGSGPQLSSIQLERLSAQVVWTLRQVPSVTSVRVLVNGVLVGPQGAPLTQSIESLPQFDPDVPPRQRGALFVARRRVRGDGLTVPPPLRGRGLGPVAMSADGGRVAALQRVGSKSRLLLGSSAGPLTAPLAPALLASPTFDPQGDLYVVSRSRGTTSLLEVPVRGRVRLVLVPSAIRKAGIDAVAISRDGSRAAMVVGPPGRAALMIGGLTGDAAHPEVGNLVPVLPATNAVEGVAWTGADKVVTTVRAGSGRRRVEESSVDGYTLHGLTSGGLRGSPTDVASAPGQATLAVADNAIWMLTRHRWQRVSTGSYPTYAG
jgi:Lipoprotein LpqB beta-propeller domain/Sporulation and spore germination